VLRDNAEMPPDDLCSRLVEAAGRRADDLVFLLIRVA
jgi:hypothetical protein